MRSKSFFSLFLFLSFSLSFFLSFFLLLSFSFFQSRFYLSVTGAVLAGMPTVTSEVLIPLSARKEEEEERERTDFALSENKIKLKK